jgi:hypothetical protein
MDSQLFQVLISIFGALFSIIGVCALWWINNIWTTVRSQGQQINSLNLELVKSYVSRTEFQDALNRIFESLEGIQREIKHLSSGQAAIKVLQDEREKTRNQR